MTRKTVIEQRVVVAIPFAGRAEFSVANAERTAFARSVGNIEALNTSCEITNEQRSYLADVAVFREYGNEWISEITNILRPLSDEEEAAYPISARYRQIRIDQEELKRREHDEAIAAVMSLPEMSVVSFRRDSGWRKRDGDIYIVALEDGTERYAKWHPQAGCYVANAITEHWSTREEIRHGYGGESWGSGQYHTVDNHRVIASAVRCVMPPKEGAA